MLCTFSLVTSSNYQLKCSLQFMKIVKLRIYCNIVNPGTPALMGGTEGVVSGQFMGHKLTMRN